MAQVMEAALDSEATGQRGKRCVTPSGRIGLEPSVSWLNTYASGERLTPLASACLACSTTDGPMARRRLERVLALPVFWRFLPVRGSRPV
jgi:hypothetical protein